LNVIALRDLPRKLLLGELKTDHRRSGAYVNAPHELGFDSASPTRVLILMGWPRNRAPRRNLKFSPLLSPFAINTKCS